MLDGKTIVVTGAASGIGAACAARYQDLGARVIATDRRPGAGQVALDVTDPDAWARLVADSPPIDILHCNAGGWTPGFSDTNPTPAVPLSDIDPAGWRSVFSVNVDGLFFGARAVLPQMVERRSGYILATASMAGLVAPPGDLGYGTTKHAVVGLVRALAQALDGKGPGIGAICPAAVDTPMVSDTVKQMMRDNSMPISPPGRVVDAAVAALEAQRNGALWTIFGDDIGEYRPPEIDVILGWS